jgi:hypothetical protein
MSLFVDKKYINFVSNYFSKFKWKSEKLANCRCIFCGDSTKNKNKMRGYFFPQNNAFFYKCHNCGVSYNVYQLLETVSPGLCREYRIECEWFKDKDIPVEPSPKKEVVHTDLDIQYISTLPSNHKARLYVEGRQIPVSHWNNLAYTEDFSSVAEKLNPDYSGRFFKEDRLLIVFKHKEEVIGLQGRSFSQRSKIKYITLKKYEGEMYYNVYNIDPKRKYYITEGPFDSMFLPNAVATLGVTGLKSISAKTDDTNGVYIIDNQPKNKDVVNILKYLIDNGKKVFICPNKIKQKDINSMVLDKIDVVDLVDNNTYQGLQALLKFNEWKKV